LDDVLLHPIYCYIGLALILLLFFQGVYGVGQLIEPPLLAFFEGIIKNINSHISSQNLIGVLINGVLQGVMAGFAIVLPYLFPFLVGLGFLEDVGYLPRIAFMMDSLMHRIGLHGKAIVPFILGYGCNVPAIMSTRTLEDSRERFIAATLSTLVPCAARLVVVFGLVAFYLGPLWALGLYMLNLFVIALTGRILTMLLPDTSPGMILEMPPYRIPTLKAVLNKAWFRIREFLVEAWPTLIFGSAALAILVFYDLAKYFNYLVKPITWLLDLPEAVGVPLIFGILRKELSLIMLGQALGSVNYSNVLTHAQLFTFTVFVVFFIPCAATLIMLKKELGTKKMLWVTVITILIALTAGGVSRLLGWLI
jgi:ferrous iron transport protein B